MRMSTGTSRPLAHGARSSTPFYRATSVQLLRHAAEAGNERSVRGRELVALEFLRRHPREGLALLRSDLAAGYPATKEVEHHAPPGVMPGHGLDLFPHADLDAQFFLDLTPKAL